MRDFRSKTVDGYIGVLKDDKINVIPAPVTVRMTSDEYGQTLSLTCETTGGYQIGIPLESVKDIVRVWNDRNRGNGGRGR